MISYAQNFEDVMLARALGDRAAGFYIDVGACYPDIASVTKHFYDAGWSGVNVEPMPEPFERLAAARSRDINLRIAVAGHDGEIDLYEGPTIGESGVTPSHAGARALRVPCVTLASLCARHANRPIDFLKVDVEGLERDVVAGGDWQRYRPTIVVIEVTKPWSTTRRDDAAEIGSILASRGYREVYFDGINAFFLASEADHLAARFSSPPNVLDRFKSAQEAALEQAVAALQRQSEQAGAAIAAADARSRQAESDLAAAVRDHHAANLSLRAALEQSRLDAEAVRQAAHRGDVLERELARANEHANDIARQLERERSKSERLTETVQAAKSHADEARVRAESAEEHARAIEARAGTAEAKAQLAQTRADHWEARARHAEAAYRSIEQSNSWRLMAPLRHLRALGRPGPETSRRAVLTRAPQALQALTRRAARTVVAGAVSTTKRLGIYEAAAAWLRTRHPSAWARAKRAMLEGVPSIAERQGAVRRDVIALSHRRIDAPGGAAAAGAGSGQDASSGSVEAIKARIRAEIQRQSSP